MQPDWAVTIGGREHASVTLDSATIRYGRGDWYSQPDPPTLDAALVAEWVTQVPALNEPVTVDALLPADPANGVPPSVLRRFTGRIVSVRYNTGTYDVQAVGNTEQLNRCMTGDQPWPAETEVGRLQRILDLPGAAVPWQVWGTSRVSFTARDVDAAKMRSAGELGREYAAQSAGLLTELRDGTVTFLTAQRLSRPPVTVTPPPWAVNADELDAALESGGVVNQAVVAYGDPVDTTQPDGTVITAQRTEQVDDASSQAAYGLRYYYLGSDLYEASDARNYGAALLANRANPYWQLPVATTELATLDGRADVLAVAQLQPGDLMRVEPLPAGAPAGSFLGLVQGWTEECSQTRWRITWDLARSDTAPLGTVTWEEPGPTYTWQLQSSSWDNANTLDDLVGV